MAIKDETSTTDFDSVASAMVAVIQNNHPEYGIFF